METASEATETLEGLVGTFRTFGEFGPVYKVTHLTGQQKVHVLVIETGEELDYSIKRAAQDPLAR